MKVGSWHLSIEKPERQSKPDNYERDDNLSSQKVIIGCAGETKTEGPLHFPQVFHPNLL